MKSLRFSLLAVPLWLSLSLVALAQEADTHHHAEAQKAGSAAAPQSAAQVSFSAIKALAGEWEGAITTDMSDAMKKQMGGGEMKPLHVSMRVTSRGNVLVHEFQEAGTPLDAKKYDHPVTMLYVDQEKLNLVHYCDAGNRPRMVANVSPDGKTFDFEFAELSGSNQHGHMAHAKFTLVDENHHVEEWTYMLPNDLPIHARFELTRVAGGMAGVTAAGK